MVLGCGFGWGWIGVVVGVVLLCCDVVMWGDVYWGIVK